MRESKNKMRSAIRLLIIISISAILSRFGLAFYRYHYNTFLLDVTHDIYKPELFTELLSNRKDKILFSVLKAGIYLFIIAWFFFLVRTVFYRKPLIAPFFERWINAIASMIKSNVDYFKSLSPVLKITLSAIVAIEAGALAYLIVALPYDYDEAYSYLYFSGNGFLSSLVFYPLPNNHVLYNILSAVMLHLPIAVIPATRVVSLVSALVATWYFFKLMDRLVSMLTAAVTTGLLVFSYPFLLYAAQARGYMLLLLCAILCVYSCVHIIDGDKTKKYYILYIASNVAGLFTIPSYLYCFLTVDILFLFAAFRSKQHIDIGRAIKANLLIGLIAGVLYLPIIWRNGFHALTSNNGVVHRGPGYITANIGSHMQETWGLLTSYAYISIYISLVLVVTLAIVFYYQKGKPRYLLAIATAMLLSPPVIICMHGVIPFARTWLYLLLPIYISVGLLVSIFIDRNSFTKRNGQFFLVLILALVTGLQLWRFEKLQKKIYSIDYSCEFYNRLLKGRYAYIQTVGYEEGNLSFYLKDILLCDARISGKYLASLPIQKNGDTTADLVILDRKTDVLRDMQGYIALKPNDSFFRAYVRKDLYERK